MLRSGEKVHNFLNNKLAHSLFWINVVKKQIRINVIETM